MPFTLSHAAAVLPFAQHLKRWHMLSAAVIGSMAPDFGFLLPWHLERSRTHSLWALFHFCLPWGLAAYWLFEVLVKPATVELLSDRAYVRAREFSPQARIGSALQWVLASAGILMGALTHLVWDAFTHEGARGVRMFPALDDSVGFAGHTFYAYRVAQQASSLFGLCIVAGIVLFALREPAPAPASRRLTAPVRVAWTCVYAAAAFAVACVSYRADAANWPPRSVSTIAELVAIGGLRGGGAALVAVSVPLLIALRYRSS